MVDIFIYGVVDPRTNTLRYIGRTKRKLKHRLSDHLRHFDNTHRSNWFKSLVTANIVPDIFIIEEATVETCQEAERFWISYFRSVGADLVNCTEGGEGTVLANRTSFRRGQTAWNKGKQYSEETRQKISEVQRGKKKGPQSPEHRAALSKMQKGKRKGLPWTDKQRAALMALRATGWHSRHNPKKKTDVIAAR